MVKLCCANKKKILCLIFVTYIFFYCNVLCEGLYTQSNGYVIFDKEKACEIVSLNINTCQAFFPPKADLNIIFLDLKHFLHFLNALEAIVSAIVICDPGISSEYKILDLCTINELLNELERLTGLRDVYLSDLHKRVIDISTLAQKTGCRTINVNVMKLVAHPLIPTKSELSPLFYLDASAYTKTGYVNSNFLESALHVKYR